MKILFDVDTLKDENYIGKILDVETILITTKELTNNFKELEDKFSNVRVERFGSRTLAEAYIKLQMIQGKDFLYTKDGDFAKSLKCDNVSTNINLLLAFAKMQIEKDTDAPAVKDNVIHVNKWSNTVNVSDDKFKVLMRW